MKHRPLFTKSLLFTPILLTVSMTIWLGSVNFRAHRAANELFMRLESQGIATVVEDLYPEVANPENDMMQHPAMIEELGFRDFQSINMINHYTNRKRIPGLSSRGMRSPRRGAGTISDVRTYFEPIRHETEKEAARELLDAMAPEVERIKPLLDAFMRPQAGFSTSRKENGPEYLDHIYSNKKLGYTNLAYVIARLAVIELALGEVESAMIRVRALFSFHRHLASPPLTFSEALGSSLVYDYIYPVIYEGIARRLWEDHHLAEFEAELAKDIAASAFVECVKGELTYAADFLRQMLMGKGVESHDWGKGWTLQPRELWNRLKEAQTHAKPRGTLIFQRIEAIESDRKLGLYHQGLPRTRFHFSEMTELEFHVSYSLDVHLKNVARRYFTAKTSTALLRTGIALERHRLEHGSHPANLAALVPQYLPEVLLDPYDDKPLRYRLQSNGSPVVWSISSDGIDGGGMPHRGPDHGDSVWATTVLEGMDEGDLYR